MRLPPRTVILMLISFSWGAALYAALFSGSSQDFEANGRAGVRWTLDEDEKLADAGEFQWQRDGGGFRKDSSSKDGASKDRSRGRGGSKGRHLNEMLNSVLTPPAVWKKKKADQTRGQGDRFSAQETLHFPLPHYSRHRHELLHSVWVAQLQAFLGGVAGSQVSLVTASIEHLDVLLNWLISAHLVATPPLVDILVLTLDKSVFDLVSQRNLSALYVHEDMVISPTVNVTRRFSQVHVVRLSVLRLMNHYGFTVVNYDCDAIILRNPQPIFDGHADADIIGTFGKGPGQLYEKWGITLNTGVMLMRSNAKIEYYWELMSAKMSAEHSTTDDQANINLVLEKLNVKWVNFDRKKNIDYLRSAVYGIGNKHIIVMLLPENKVCRYICNPLEKEEYYVWHTYAIKENRTVENKMAQARVGSAWFLRSDWSDVSHDQSAGSQLMGAAWLRQIADSELIR